MRIIAIACAAIVFILAGSWAYIFLQVAAEGQVILVEPIVWIAGSELVTTVLIMCFAAFVVGLFVRRLE